MRSNGRHSCITPPSLFFVSAILAHVVVAEEAKFDSNRQSLFTRNLRSSPAPTVKDSLPQVENQLRLLLFWAVGGTNDVIDLVMKNIRHARASLHHVDVYLAHYDSNKKAWQGRAGWQWYKDNVNFSAQVPGFKFELAEKLLPSPKESKFSLDNYDWVWCLDEDIDFSNTALAYMMHIAEESGSLIALPAFTEIMDRNGDPIQYPFQLPHSECTFRYVPMVEVIFPMLRPSVLKILGTCEHCIHSYSVWGLDKVWCSWSAEKLGTRKDQACIIIDQTPVIHRNFKHLKGKYTGRQERKAFLDHAYDDMMDVKSHHPIEFVSQAPKTALGWQCVREGPHGERPSSLPLPRSFPDYTPKSYEQPVSKDSPRPASADSVRELLHRLNDRNRASRAALRRRSTSTSPLPVTPPEKTEKEQPKPLHHQIGDWLMSMDKIRRDKAHMTQRGGDEWDDP